MVNNSRLDERLTTANDPVSERSVEPHAEGRTVSIPSEWDVVRSRALKPLNVSECSEDATLRAEFITGAEAMGLGTWRMPELFPQQLLMADLLNAGQKFTSVLMPRRSTKTTTLLAWLIGRCLSRPGTAIHYTMLTSGLKTSDRFLRDVVPPMLAAYPDEDTRPFRVYKGAGRQSIQFDNGSMFMIGAPKGDSYRSEAFDIIAMDEAGEGDPELVKDLIGAALPTMDTRPGAMLVVAGTAGKFRDGNLLYDSLAEARKGGRRTALLEYAVPDSTDAILFEDWETTAPLVLASHPGVGVSVQLEDIEDTYRRLTDRAQFAREYLGVFGIVGGASFINPKDWEAAAFEGDRPDLPDHFGLAFSVAHNQTSAAICAAWRVDGVAHIALLEHGPGVDWVSTKALTISRKYRTPITYDGRNSNELSEVEQLNRATPRPRLNPLNWATVSTGAATLMRDIENRKLKHFSQPPMDDAARIVIKRGTPNSPKWSFGLSRDGGDITPLEAALAALVAYDAKPQRRAMPRMTGS
jgi:hypothetical protein